MNRIDTLQIEFAEWTQDGHLRHSKFIGLREDKKDLLNQVGDVNFPSMTSLI